MSAEMDRASNAFLCKYDTWLKTRNNSISKLEDLADNLDTHHKNVNIANLTASSVGVAGGALAVTGAVLSFFTFGLATPLAVMGTSMAITSGVTGIGASLAEYGITKDHCNDAQNVYDDDMKCTEQLEEALNGIDELNESLEAILAVLNEYESDLIAYSETECQTKLQEAVITEKDSLECSASVAEDQTKEVSRSAKDSSGASKRISEEYVVDKSQYQKLMTLKSAHVSTQETVMHYSSAEGSTASHVALGVPAAVIGAGAVAVITSRMGKAVKVAKLAGNMGKLTKFAGTMGKMGKLGSVGSNAAKVGKMTKLSGTVGKVGKLGSVGSNAMKVGGAALSVVGVAFDIWMIVSTAEDMSEGSKSPAGQSLRNRSGELRRHRKNVSDRAERVKKGLRVGVPLAVGVVGLVIASKKDPKKGHHVINNDVRRVLPKIIDDFIKKNNGYFRGKSKYSDLKEKIGASCKVRKAYEKPLLKEDDLAIQYKLVVYTPTNETHNEQNAQKYGAAIKELRKDVVDYMTQLFEEMSRNNGRMPSMQCNETIEKDVDTMNVPGEEVYVDRQALKWWLNKGGKWADYERVRNHVAEMFDRLKSKEILDWISELYKVHKEMN